MATKRKKPSLRVEVGDIEISGRGELIQLSGAGRATTESVRRELAKARAALKPGSRNPKSPSPKSRSKK